MKRSKTKSLRSNRAIVTIFGLVLAVASVQLVCVQLVRAAGPGFRTRHLLEEHYARYGPGFGKITQDQYLRMAQQLRDSHAGKNVLEAKRPGGMSKFDRRTGWFVDYDADRTIRTFFIPKDGLRYFERQARNPRAPE